MFSVSSEPAVNASYQAGQSRSKSARDDQAPQGDSFASMVDSNNAAGSDRTAPPEAPAPRSDDRPSAVDRPDNSDRNRDAAGKAADAAQNARSADARSAQAQQKASDKADKDAAGDAKAKEAKDSRTAASKTSDTDSPDAKTSDVATDGDKPVVTADAAVPAIAVNIMPIVTPIPVASVVPVTATPVSGLPTPAVTDVTQPLAIAAAVLKAQAAAAEADAAGTEVPAPAEASATDAQFAALIAAATPAAGKTSVKQAAGKTDDATTGEAIVTTDASTETTTATTIPAVPAAATGPANGKADDATVATDGKLDASVADATAKPAAHAAHERNADAAPSLAPADLAPTSNNMQPQPLQATAPAALTAQQLTANIATNAPVPVNGLAVEIAQYAQAGKSRFDIRLDPAELGRIDVRLDVDRHGNVTSHLVVEKAETLAMLRQDAPQLQRALEQAGMKTSESGLQFSLRDQSSGQQNSGDNSGRQSQRLIISEDESMPAVSAGRNYGRMLGSSRGIDISI